AAQSAAHAGGPVLRRCAVRSRRTTSVEVELVLDGRPVVVDDANNGTVRSDTAGWSAVRRLTHLHHQRVLLANSTISTAHLTEELQVLNRGREGFRLLREPPLSSLLRPELHGLDVHAGLPGRFVEELLGWLHGEVRTVLPQDLKPATRVTVVEGDAVDAFRIQGASESADRRAKHAAPDQHAG